MDDTRRVFLVSVVLTHHSIELRRREHGHYAATVVRFTPEEFFNLRWHRVQPRIVGDTDTVVEI